MTAEQVICAAIIRQIGTYTYRELACHLADSRVYSHFCKIGIGKADPSPKNVDTELR